MKLNKIMIGIGIVLIVFIPIWLFLIVPELEKMPGDYGMDVKLLSSEQTRYDLGGELGEMTILNGYIKINVEQTSGNGIEVNELFHIEYLNGELSYETLDDLEVNRKSRKLIGSEVNYMFPIDMKKKDYLIHFPGWEFPIEAKYIGEEIIDGLDVYRYGLSLTNGDLTSSFEFLDLVPEEYDVLTDAEGFYLVEPVTGILVNYEESGTNYYVTKENMEKVQEFSIFSNKFSDDTIANQVRLAQNEKQKIYLIEWIVPILLGLIGIALILSSYIGRRFLGGFDGAEGKKTIKPEIPRKKEVRK
jgi:hypothetical protein